MPRRRSRRLGHASSLPAPPSPVGTGAPAVAEPDGILLLTIELLVSVLAFITSPRDLAAAALACSHFGHAASEEAAWRHGWYALIAGKLYVPPRAAGLVSGPAPQFRSAILSAREEIRAATISLEQLVRFVWERRSKPTRWHDKHDGWLRGKACGSHRLNSDGSVTVLRGENPLGKTETWRFVRRCGGRIVPFGAYLRTRVKMLGGSSQHSVIKAGSYQLPPRRIMHRALRTGPPFR